MCHCLATRLQSSLYMSTIRRMCHSACQCGDFYEAVGMDAVLLVQFAGLNPMGNRSPPRAGCPKGNIHRVLADLVQGAGFTVVRLSPPLPHKPHTPVLQFCSVSARWYHCLPMHARQAVCEEVGEDYVYGVKKPRKERYLAGVMSPASPYYMHGAIDGQQARVKLAAPPQHGWNLVCNLSVLWVFLCTG